MTRPSRKIRRARDPEHVKLAKARGIYAAETRPDEYDATYIVNFSAGDARELERSKNHIARERERQEPQPKGKVDESAKRTIRRKPKIDELVTRKVISPDEALFCEWYYNQHEALYETKCKVANWAATGGSSDQAFGHWPANVVLHPGKTLFDMARESLGAKRWLFERVVLQGRPLGKLAITFRQAVRQLRDAVEGRAELPEY